MGRGLDGIFTHEPFAMTITSGYRNPGWQAVVTAPKSYPNDRHTHGDAVDIATSGPTQWTAMSAAAQYGIPGGTPCIEPVAISGTGHVHVDWREVCPTGW